MIISGQEWIINYWDKYNKPYKYHIISNSPSSKAPILRGPHVVRFVDVAVHISLLGRSQCCMFFSQMDLSKNGVPRKVHWLIDHHFQCFSELKLSHWVSSIVRWVYKEMYNCAPPSKHVYNYIYIVNIHILAMWNPQVVSWFVNPIKYHNQ